VLLTWDLDSVQNLENLPIYLASGGLDTVVTQKVMTATEHFYIDIGVDPSFIQTMFTIPAEHGWMTTDLGGPCDEINTPNYVSDCDVNLAENMLQWLYADTLAVERNTTSGGLFKFSQTDFCAQRYGGCNSISMSDDGYVYIPSLCMAGGCRLVTVLHGCLQTVEMIGTSGFINQSGFNELADQYGLVILYPQTTKSTLSPANPEACWDWWGYTGTLYATNEAPQIKAIKAMMDKVMYT